MKSDFSIKARKIILVVQVLISLVVVVAIIVAIISYSDLALNYKALDSFSGAVLTARIGTMLMLGCSIVFAFLSIKNKNNIENSLIGAFASAGAYGVNCFLVPFSNLESRIRELISITINKTDVLTGGTLGLSRLNYTGGQAPEIIEKHIKRLPTDEGFLGSIADSIIESLKGEIFEIYRSEFNELYSSSPVPMFAVLMILLLLLTEIVILMSGLSIYDKQKTTSASSD